MPNFTPNFALPYPAPDDAPCDFDEQWCEFTEGLDRAFDTLQVVADRTNPIIPIAVIEATVVLSVPSNSKVPFDTVIVDTAGMTDMDADPFTITIKRPGRYTLAGGIEALTAFPGVPPGFFGISIISSGSLNAETYDFALGPVPLGVTTERTVISLNPGTQVQMSYTFGTVGSFQVNWAWLAVAWHSDTEVPL